MRIGLDIKTSSIGWATVLINETVEPISILDMGVRVFELAEHQKDGSALALLRRRCARRKLRLHKHRLERTKHLLETLEIEAQE